MNNETYKYVQQICKKIKNKEDIEDTQQNVFLILIEKDLINKPLTIELQNYIKGIVWNTSTTLYNQFNQDTFELTATANNIQDYIDNEPEYVSDSIEFITSLSLIKKYVFENYYKKKKNLMKWRVFYLQLINNDYRYVSDRLKLTHSTCIEYNYLALKEIKEKLGFEISKKVSELNK